MSDALKRLAAQCNHRGARLQSNALRRLRGLPPISAEVEAAYWARTRARVARQAGNDA